MKEKIDKDKINQIDFRMPDKIDWDKEDMSAISEESLRQLNKDLRKSGYDPDWCDFVDKVDREVRKEKLGIKVIK